MITGGYHTMSEAVSTDTLRINYGTTTGTSHIWDWEIHCR
jgi:hypothetical protein